MNPEHFLFVEKYRPKTIEDCVLPKELKDTFQGYIKQGRIPHLLLSGPPGTGKSSVARALCIETGVDYIIINGSLENGIDLLRSKLLSFAATISLTDSKKVIIIDEAEYLNCLDENETIQIGTLDNFSEVQLKDLKVGVEYSLISFNTSTGIFENDVGFVVSDHEQEVYELTLENGQTVLVTADHPFIIQENGQFIECTINDGIFEKEIVIKP